MHGILNIADWNGLDWTLIAIMALSTLRAFMRGLVQALFGLIGFVGGFQLASWNYAGLGNWVYERQWVASYAVARMVAFLAIAALVVVICEFLGYAVKKSAHKVGFGTFDRILGAFFGLVRGILMGVVVIVAITAFARQSSWVQRSQLSSYFLAAAHAVSFVVPHDLR